MGGRGRLAIVGVMGSGSQPHLERSVALGRWLASQGVHLLTGGGGGVMEAVSRAFCEVRDREGLSIGILPGRGGQAAPGSPPGYPNPWVEIPIRTHLPLSGDRGTDLRSRNHINVLSCDLLVALPGGEGTASEVQLALRYARPLVAYLADRSEIEGLPQGAVVSSTLAGVQGFVRTRLAELRQRRSGERG